MSQTCLISALLSFFESRKEAAAAMTTQEAEAATEAAKWAAMNQLIAGSSLMAGQAQRRLQKEQISFQEYSRNSRICLQKPAEEAGMKMNQEPDTTTQQAADTNTCWLQLQQGADRTMQDSNLTDLHIDTDLSPLESASHTDTETTKCQELQKRNCSAGESKWQRERHTESGHRIERERLN